MSIRFIFAGAAVLLCALQTGCASMSLGSDVTRYKGASNFPIAMGVEVPAGKNLVFLSGATPPVSNPKAPKDSQAAYGDTQTQTYNVLKTIEDNLKSMGLGMKDVVKMTVFLAGDPNKGGAMDFGGMMAAYTKFFGTADQPNLPSRSTVQVAQLVNPVFLVEIEVVAVRP
ncbi:Enamine deaminase RidA, house cleaning of reactive enamine intermediates, YjgF/YER057c/UK114 family [Solimonas aquatica]|uniref:Enamine deaminase RidA, house cleaning of reactive enamine intermediates, YjgF/YER057c/UK114 family n=1 Tax=Solimonas aquatica TaxID=489703 RepID=A0A1H9FUN7_9GAMM|nr:RidA family protein [Solimonas aquatica]SEQ41594.1 Enamine deaminase RidA, house cleaning of reactive enamine intermediates, YjgF/YER057c/UK114 family [Solimonas aquatica]